MTTLSTLVFEDLKIAMREKNVLAKGALTLLKSNLNQAEKEKGSQLTKDEEIGIVQGEIKQHHQTIEAAQKALRADIIKNEAIKVAILEKYLPKQLTPKEALDVLSNEIKSGMNMGEGMKIAKQLINGQIDNKLMSELVRELIK